MDALAAATATAAAAAVGLLARAVAEPFLPVFDMAELHPGDGPAGPPLLRLFVLSDLHAGLCGIGPGRPAAAARSSGAAGILFLGDLSNGPRDFPRAIRWMVRLAAESGLPVWMVPGNHDQWIWRERPDLFASMRKAFEGAGIRVLLNEGVRIPGLDGNPVLLSGLEDRAEGRPDPEAALAAGRDLPPTRRILAAHNPDMALDLSPNQAAFLLAGHFHGGQVWMPFRLEFRLLRREQLAREGFIQGPFRRQGVTGFISRGLGCVLVPFRLGSRPQGTLVVLSTNAVI